VESKRKTWSPLIYTLLQFASTLLAILGGLFYLSGAIKACETAGTNPDDCFEIFLETHWYFFPGWLVAVLLVWWHFDNLIWLMEAENARIEKDNPGRPEYKGSGKAHSLEDLNRAFKTQPQRSPFRFLHKEFHGWSSCVVLIVLTILMFIAIVIIGNSSIPK
jgi:hypothetical protein